jgi:hypothetical protein
VTIAVLEQQIETEAPAQNPTNGTKTKPGPKPRKSGSDELVRYFLAKPGSSTAKPELGEEFNSEAEAQIQAFRAQQPYYVITAFEVDADMKGERPTLVPRARRA